MAGDLSLIALKWSFTFELSRPHRPNRNSLLHQIRTSRERLHIWITLTSLHASRETARSQPQQRPPSQKYHASEPRRFHICQPNVGLFPAALLDRRLDGSTAGVA